MPLAGARRAGQARESGELGERRLDAPERDRTLANPERRVGARNSATVLLCRRFATEHLGNYILR